MNDNSPADFFSPPKFEHERRKNIVELFVGAVNDLGLEIPQRPKHSKGQEQGMDDDP